MGTPINKLEFEKDTLEPHINIKRENIQLRIKNIDQFYVKSVSNLDIPKSSVKATGNFAKKLCRMMERLLP